MTDQSAEVKRAAVPLRGRTGVLAVEAATYAVARRGGDFERLRKNLAFLRELRRSSEIERLEFSIVVQSLNFRQMPAFVKLGEEFAADLISV